MRALELEAGQRFGKWTVLYRDGVKSGGAAWMCQCECGNQRALRASVLKRSRSVQCSECRFDKTEGLKARWTTAKGYVVMRGNGHANAWANGNMHEHVYVMSGMLGRPLLPGENVHHKNGNRSDNDPSNLELWVNHQPTGQRVEDLVCWAHEILERYETGHER